MVYLSPNNKKYSTLNYIAIIPNHAPQTLFFYSSNIFKTLEENDRTIGVFIKIKIEI